VVESATTSAEAALEEGFARRSRPALYVVAIVLAALGAYAHNLSVSGIYACPATGYTADRFLGYCQAEHYGDYEHGAFWFGLEPGIARSLSHAQVVFLGNSRLQWGFSSPVTADWFSRLAVPYYLLGFEFDETYRFEGPLLHKFNAKPRVYVISLDAFFASQLSPPAQYVMNDQMAAVHYESEHIAQYFHRQICGRLPSLCGKEYSVYRSERTGAWYATPARFLRVPAVADTAIDQAKASQELVAARAFLASLPVEKDCIILTIVPTVGTRRDAAAALAGALDRPFVSPELTGLYTFDGSHLEPQSAQRWAQAFFDAAGPRIRACVGGAGAPAALAAPR